MAYETFSVEIDGDGIALVTIDLPGQSMNVWNEALITELRAWAEEFAQDDSIKGAVIASGKKTGFLAGADLRMIAEADMGADGEDPYDGKLSISPILRILETCGHSAKAMLKGEAFAKPVAVAVEGLALGGGLELVLAGHYRVVADNPKIQLGLPEVKVGLLPGAGGTQRTPRLIGLQNAAMLATQGNPIDPQTALKQGLISEIVPPGETVAAAKKWVKENPQVLQPWDKKGFKFPGGAGAMDPRSAQFFMAANALAQKETKHNYPAVEAILSCLYEGSIVPFDTALRIETKYFAKLLADPVAGNMIRSLFVNKQALEKGAKRPKGVDPVDIKKVGVLGGGLMGSGIAHVTVKGGMDVVVLDRTKEDAEKAVAYSKAILDKRVARGKMSQDKADAFLARIQPTEDYNDLKDVDLIIEAVFERPDVKAEVTKKAEAMIRPDVVFASNTSTLPITGLAENSERPDQFIGMHFFSPVEKMPLLEIIPGEKTGERAIAVAFDYNSKIKKTPIVVKDVRGFYTNRVFPAYVNEAVLLLTEGVNPALIENCAKKFGMPVGPLAVLDETSLSLGYDVQESTKKEMGDAYEPTGAEGFFEKMVVELKRMGRKSGGGIYEYPEDGPKRLWPGLSDHYPLLENQPSADEVTERLVYAQLIATAKCYAEEVVGDPASADLGAIFGWGFSPWTGGPLSFIDTIGAKEFVETSDRLAAKNGSRFEPPQMFRDLASQDGKLYEAA